MFWPIFRRVLLTFPLAVQTATNSELPTRQKEGGGGWLGGGGGVREGPWSSDRGDRPGLKMQDACKVLSQHIFNERDGVMWGKKESSRRWMHKIWLHCISPVINFASLMPHILYGQRTEKVAFRLQWAIDVKGRIISSEQMIQCDSATAPQKKIWKNKSPKYNP